MNDETSQAVDHAINVLTEVLQERHRQDAKWGEQNHPSTHANGAYDYGLPSASEAQACYENAANVGMATWGDIALEEFCEVLDAPNDDERRTELIQLAAVCTAWVECIDRRKRRESSDAVLNIIMGGDTDRPPGFQCATCGHTKPECAEDVAVCFECYQEPQL